MDKEDEFKLLLDELMENKTLEEKLTFISDINTYMINVSIIGRTLHNKQNIRN